MPIAAHWGKFGQTFGFQCWTLNDFRKGYVLRTQVTLTAVGGDIFVLSGDMSASVNRLIPPPVFPSDLLHEFKYTLSPQSLHARIVGDKLGIFVSFDKNVPWRQTRDNKYWGVFFDHQTLTSIPSLMLLLKFQSVFHPPKVRPAPLEFEWGTPRVVSSAFETKRSKH